MVVGRSARDDAVAAAIIAVAVARRDSESASGRRSSVTVGCGLVSAGPPHARHGPVYAGRVLTQGPPHLPGLQDAKGLRRVEVHHLIQHLENGGSDDLENLICLCYDCHRCAPCQRWARRRDTTRSAWWAALLYKGMD